MDGGVGSYCIKMGPWLSLIPASCSNSHTCACNAPPNLNHLFPLLGTISERIFLSLSHSFLPFSLPLHYLFRSSFLVPFFSFSRFLFHTPPSLPPISPLPPSLSLACSLYLRTWFQNWIFPKFLRIIQFQNVTSKLNIFLLLFFLLKSVA